MTSSCGILIGKLPSGPWWCLGISSQPSYWLNKLSPTLLPWGWNSIMSTISMLKKLCKIQKNVLNIVSAYRLTLLSDWVSTGIVMTMVQLWPLFCSAKAIQQRWVLIHFTHAYVSVILYESVVLKLILPIDIMSISLENYRMWMSQSPLMISQHWLR